MFMPASARGGQLGDAKALNASALYLVERLPLSRSESKQMHTSGTLAWPSASFAAAISTADIRFSFPSVRGTPIGSWLPVKTTGLVSPSSMKLSVEAL
jgi:hypothetical protein